jgi:hypothetical protein
MNRHGQLQTSQLIERAWQRFNNDYPTEEHCIAELRRALPKSCLTCRVCGTAGVGELTARILRCPRCKTPIFLTERTIFRRARRLRPWFAAMYLLELRVPISAHRFSILSAVAYDTARSMFLKLREESSKRGKSVHQSLHFFIAECTSLNKPVRALSSGGDPQLEPNELAVFATLNIETPTNFDAICQITKLPPGRVSASLTLLELNGLIRNCGFNSYRRI